MSLDPFEGMGERAKQATDEMLARQKAKLDQEKVQRKVNN